MWGGGVGCGGGSGSRRTSTSRCRRRRGLLDLGIVQVTLYILEGIIGLGLQCFLGLGGGFRPRKFIMKLIELMIGGDQGSPGLLSRPRRNHHLHVWGAHKFINARYWTTIDS